MKIERIIKKDENTVKILFNDGQYLFLSYETFLKNGLRKNDEISDDRFAFLLEENQKYHIKQKIFRLLARRLHTSKELWIKLKQKKYDSDLINAVINELTDKKIIDEMEFAERFIDEKINLKGWSKNKTKAELFKRGVESEIINSSINNITNEDSEFSNAIKFGRKKLSSLINRKKDKAWIKKNLFDSICRKGFSYEIAKRVLKQLSDEELI